MGKMMIAVVSAVSLTAVAAWGQEEEKTSATAAPLSTSIPTSAVTPTPEMWFYQQYRSDYQDPKMAVRQRAEFRADQRRRRLAALKWFGFSNQRPSCSSDPFHGDWSPSWSSNNRFYPWRWQGNGPYWIVVRPESYGTWIR